MYLFLVSMSFDDIINVPTINSSQGSKSSSRYFPPLLTHGILESENLKRQINDERVLFFFNYILLKYLLADTLKLSLF